MKLHLTSTTLFLALGPIAFAATPEAAIIAAMQLVETPNYSWRCSVTDDARTYEVTGKTSGRYTWQAQPMPNSIACRMGRDASHQLEAIFAEKLHYVIRTPSGWKKLEELPERHADWQDETEWLLVTLPSTPALRTPDMPADLWETDLFGLPPAVYLPVLRATGENNGDRVYSNYQFALSLPHEELATIVSSHTDLTMEGNMATGTITDLGARLLLVHDGHEYIQPVIATGRFRLWLANATVQKYTVELAGIVVVDRKTVYVRQKSTTEVSELGATSFAIPLDAQRRL